MEIGIIGRSEITYDSMLLMVKNGFSISFIVTSKESKEHLEDGINHRLLIWSFMNFEWLCKIFLKDN
jgi:asparagine synthase (glutamine-hydrolysing)